MGLHRYRYVYRHSSSLPPTHGYSATGAIFYISLRPETSLSVRSSPSHSNFVIIALVSGWSLLALEPGRLYRVKQYSSVGGWFEPETSLVREWEIPLRFSSFNVMWCFTHNATPNPQLSLVASSEASSSFGECWANYVYPLWSKGHACLLCDGFVCNRGECRIYPVIFFLLILQRFLLRSGAAVPWCRISHFATNRPNITPPPYKASISSSLRPTDGKRMTKARAAMMVTSD